MFVLKDRKLCVNAVAFSPDGTRLAAACQRAVLQLWDVGAGKLAWSSRIGTSTVTDAAFLPGRREILVHNEGLLKAFDAATGANLGVRPRTNRVTICAAGLSPDGDRLAAAFLTSLILYKLPDFQKVWGVRIPRGDWPQFLECTAAACSYGGDLIAVGRSDGRVILHDGATGAVAGSDGSGAAVKAMAFSPDGSRLARCASSHLYLSRVDPFEPLAHHQLGKTSFLSVAFHPSGAFFATANGDGKVDYWDSHTGERRESFDWGVGKLNDVTFDSTGDRAACCSETGEIVVWDVDR
jgi:WD40 repeat protein